MKIHLNLRNIKIVGALLSLLTVLVLITRYGKSKYDGSETYTRIGNWKRAVGNLSAEPGEVDTDYIDPFQSLLIQDSDIHNKVGGSTCKEKRNFVFIKTMKCATQTVAMILRRFGYLRYLNFVLPKGDNLYLGWPFILEAQDYRPSRRPYNALVEHSVYNRTIMSALMPKDTKFITIIREPFSHFRSVFNYFNVGNISKVEAKDQVSEWLLNLNKYDTLYKSHQQSEKRYCIPDGFSITKNLLSHCLGMPIGFPVGRANITNDDVKVLEYIHQLDAEFDLVMIMEYFHESLVLLKRTMCWSLQDLLYQAFNVGKYGYKNTEPKEEHLQIYKHWSHLDYLLYDHFNRTFWKKIQMQTDNFQQEVATFTKIQADVSEYCSHMTEKEPALQVTATDFNEAFSVTKETCLMLGVELLTFLKKRFDREEDWVMPESEKNFAKRGC